MVDPAEPPDPAASEPPPVPGAEPLATTCGVRRRPSRSRARLLRGTWVVDGFEGLSEGFAGIAVTRAGRVWSSATRELRQAAAVGEERVLAERNRREKLIRASETAAQAELEAKQALERLARVERRPRPRRRGWSTRTAPP